MGYGHGHEQERNRVDDADLPCRKHNEHGQHDRYGETADDGAGDEEGHQQPRRARQTNKQDAVLRAIALGIIEHLERIRNSIISGGQIDHVALADMLMELADRRAADLTSMPPHR